VYHFIEVYLKRKKFKKMDLKKLKKQYNVPWITEEGYMDYSKYPIEQPAKNALSKDDEKFRNACSLLGSMAREGNKEAAVYLFGLISYYEDDIKKMEIIIKNIGYFKTKQGTNFLFGELERVKSSNKTRIYFNTIIERLSFFPPDLVLEKLIELSENKNFSYRMRKKFSAVVEELNYKKF